MKTRIFTLLAPLVLLTGCMTAANQAPKADHIVQQLNQAIQQQQWTKAEALFSPDFFKQTPKGYWEQSMKQILKEKGAIQTVNMVSHQKDPRFGGDFYIYVLSVIHEHGTSHETVTIIQPIDGDKPMVVSGFQIK